MTLKVEKLINYFRVAEIVGQVFHSLAFNDHFCTNVRLLERDDFLRTIFFPAFSHWQTCTASLHYKSETIKAAIAVRELTTTATARTMSINILPTNLAIL